VDFLGGLEPDERPGQAATSQFHSQSDLSLANAHRSFELVRGVGCHFGKSEWQLGFAPQLINGEPYIHALDVEKNIQPLLNGISDIVITKRIVVLDPGHGGEDPGTKSVIANHFEKDYTLDWARRLRPLLEAQGWKVYLTRTNDVRLSLSDRVGFADRVGAILFTVSFSPAFPNLKQSGLKHIV
jgi:N-acetylmuramoyl-L-alanine amidase